MSDRRDDPPGRRGLQPIGRLLDDALDQLGLRERAVERRVLARWADIVGAEIAGHSRALDIQGGVLIIEADHGAWRQELTMLMPRIIEKFNSLCGEGTVTDIQWRERPQRGRSFRS